MKKYLKILLVILTFLPLTAAAQIRIDIDNIDNVVLDVNNEAPTYKLVDGKYVIEMNRESNLRVIAKEGILFTEVTFVDNYLKEETSWNNRVDVLEDGRSYVDISSSFPEDEYFRIRTSDASDARSASCTVNVDDPSRVLLKRKGVEIELTEGANTIKFDPSTEAELEIEPVGKPLYRVTKGVEELTTDYRYIIPIVDGDVINIVSEYPDQDCPVKFTLTGNGADDFITEVDVDGRPEFNWRADGFTVKCGTELKMKGNTNEYEVLSFKINGKSEMFANPTTILITAQTEISIEVRKYASFLMTINVDDPTHVKAYRGHAANNDLFDLVAGNNTVEVTRNTPIVSFIPEPGFYIETLSVNCEDLDVEDLKISPVRIGRLTDNDKIELTTAEIVRDMTAMIYIENLEPAKDYFRLLRANRSEVEGLHEGYNELKFYDRDNYFSFETGGPIEAHFYVNGELEEPAPGGYTYKPMLTDGDVVKIYFGEAPAKHTISFNVDENIADAVSVVTDHIVTVPTFNDLSVLHNSHVKIATTKASSLKVTLDEAALTPDPDGNYTFTAVGDHTVNVSSVSSGIDTLPTVNAKERIYNIQGMPVDAPFETLPSGLYIIGGTKVLKK